MNPEEITKPLVETKPESVTETETKPVSETKPETVTEPVNAKITVARINSMNCVSNGRAIYSVFHAMMTLIALYLAFRCNNGFNWWSFLAALFFPYIYVMYIVATRGTCGIFESK